MAPAPLAQAVRAALPTPSQGGFGLVELLLVGAVGTVVLAAAYGMYQAAENTGKINRETDHVTAITDRVINLYASQGGFSTLNNNAAINGEVFPSGMVNTSGLIRNTWGGTVIVEATPVSIGGAPPSSDKSFKIAYDNVAPRACSTFVTNAGPGFFDVRVNGTTVLSNGQVSASLAATRCETAPVALVEFVHAQPFSSNGPASCTLPPNEVENQSYSCPASQLITSVGPSQYLGSGPQSRNRSPFCNSGGTVDWGPWGSWTPTYSCAPACSTVNGTDNGTFTCPAGQVISNVTAPSYQYLASAPRSRSSTQTCSTPVGPLNAATYGAWSPTYTCAPTCSATSVVESQPGTCPPGTSGTWTQTRNRNNACSTPIGPLGAPTYTAWTPASAPVGTCVAPPPSCPPAPAPTSQSLTCPAGQSGTWTQQRGWNGAPAPTCWTAGSWVDTVNTCAPTPPSCPPAPAPASQSLTCPAGQSGTWTQQRGWNAAPAPTCWTTGSWVDTVNTCAPTPPACPPAPATATQSLTCPAGQTGTWTQQHGWNAAAAPTCWTAAPWSNTVYTCAPPTCPAASPPASTPSCRPSNYLSIPGYVGGGASLSGGSWMRGAFPGCGWTYTGGTCYYNTFNSNAQPETNGACAPIYPQTSAENDVWNVIAPCGPGNNGWGNSASFCEPGAIVGTVDGTCASTNSFTIF